ncbi:hypothetical protein D3C72_2050260 [compost metagenome]
MKKTLLLRPVKSLDKMLLRWSELFFLCVTNGSHMKSCAARLIHVSNTPTSSFPSRTIMAKSGAFDRRLESSTFNVDADSLVARITLARSGVPIGYPLPDNEGAGMRIDLVIKYEWGVGNR